MKREEIVNFNAGPAGLPTSSLLRAREELLDFEGSGMSIIEHSHRGPEYEAVHHRAIELVKSLLAVPSSHEVLLLQGGASTCFATVPMNFLPPGKSADYLITGFWSKKALSEAQIVGKARSAGSGEVDGKFVKIPKQSELSLDPEAAYVHLTTNNTIAGTQWSELPEVGAVPLVADMSSDFMWRPTPVEKFGFIYAGAQKNVGPSGLVVAIVNRAWVERASTAIPNIFRVKTHLENQSLYNTPPTFSIYLLRNVLEDLANAGGLVAVERKNREKGRILYATIDQSDGFYRSPVQRDARSFMNVVFRLPDEDREKRFLNEAQADGLVGLKGHRSVGGVRASLYNAVSVEGVQRLAEFMQAFRQRS